MRSALEAAAAGALGTALALLVWRGPGEDRAIALGVSVAWLASSLGAGALILARARSPKAFWWAFGGGMTLRLAALAGLMAYSVSETGLSQPALLLSYVFGVLCFLMLEYRHVRLR